MQASRDGAEEAPTWQAAAKPTGVLLLTTIMLSVDALNPVKVLCSYAKYCDGPVWPVSLCLSEVQIAIVAGALLLALLVDQRRELLYYSLRLFFRCSFNNMFFRSVEIVGADNVPKDGPVILAGNHNNQFVDGAILLTNCDRQISFMIAQKSWERPMIGFFAHTFKCIPVGRPQDSAFEGAGKVRADGSATLRGEATEFLKQVEPGVALELPSSGCAPPGGTGKIVKVKHVESDTLLTFVEKVGAPTEFSNYKIYPKIDQRGMYDTVYSGLRKGACLGTFPEGGSHDRTDLLPLKAGIAVIALDAYSKHHMFVPIVPVGLNYFQGHRFGGRVVVEFGPPIIIPEEIYVQHETDRRAATEALLQLITTGMRGVIVPTPDYYTLQQIYMLRKLYVPDGLKLSAEQIMDLNRRFAVGIQRILKMHAKASEAMIRTTSSAESRGGIPGLTSNSPRPLSPQGAQSPAALEEMDFELQPEEVHVIDSFRAELKAYMATLKRLGLRDYHVRQIGWWSFADFIGRLLYFLIAIGVGAIPQLMFNLPVMFIASKLAGKEQLKSLKASSVKLAARDVVMSYKVIYVLMLIPCLYIIYGSMIVLSTRWTPTTVVLVLAVLPFFAFLGTKASEQGVRAYADVVPLILRLLPGPRREQDALPERRAALQKRLNQVVRRFGPRLGELYTRKSVDWTKEMGWFSRTAASGDPAAAAPAASAAAPAAVSTPAPAAPQAAEPAAEPAEPAAASETLETPELRQRAPATGSEKVAD